MDNLILHKAILFSNGLKYKDFVVFNPLEYDFSNEDLHFFEIRLMDTEFWRKIKSFTWSVNMLIFCVVNSDNIIAGNIYENNAMLCNNTVKVFDQIINFKKI